MKKPNDADRLNHILDAISKIERYLKGFDLQKFESNELTVDAVVRIWKSSVRRLRVWIEV